MSAPGGSDPVAPVGGGMFEVNIAEAPRAIRELETALEELKDIRRRAVSLGQVNPSATDEVSVDAAAALGKAAVGGPESFTQALDQGITELDRVVRARMSGFDAYRQNGEDGAQALGRSI